MQQSLIWCVCLSRNLFLFQKNFDLADFKERLKALLTSAQTVDHLKAYHQLLARNFAVKISEECAACSMFEELAAFANERYGDKIEIFEAQDSRRKDSLISKEDAEMLFLETVKSRHFMRISLKDAALVPSNLYFYRMYISYDNDGNGQLRMANASFELQAPLPSGECTEYVKRKIRLFAQSPFFVADEILREQYALPHLKRQMEILENGKNSKIDSYPSMIFSIGLSACYHLRDQSLGLSYTAPAKSRKSGANYVMTALNEKAGYALKCEINEQGLCAVTLQRVSYASPYRNSYDLRKFLLKKMALLPTHMYLKEAMLELSKLTPLDSNESDFAQLYRVLGGKAVETA